LGGLTVTLKALELKLAECQSVVDEVGDPPLKFLKAAERVKMVPNTTHRLGQGGIPDFKAAFVSTLNPLLHFFPAKTHMLVSFCRIKLDMRFFTYCIMGTVQEVQEEDQSCRNEYGPRAWQGASFSTC